MGNPVLAKTYVAGGAIGSHRIVKFSADGVVEIATAAGDDLIGVSVGPNIDVVAEQRLDVIRSGIADILYGGPVNAGQQLTSDGEGRAVAATGGDTIIGRAEESGVLNDISRAFLS